MIGPMGPAQARLPNHGAEHQNREREEHARNLEPHNSTDPAKGLQESANPARCSTCKLSHSPPGGLPCCAALCGTGRRDRASVRLTDCRLRTGRDALAGNASGDAQSNAQCPPDGLRFHFDLDGNSAPYGSRFRFPISARLFDRLSPPPGCSWGALEVR